MSWDLFIADIPAECETTDDIPEGWDTPMIGTYAELIAKIKAIIPHADFSNPKHGVIEGVEWSIEIPIAGPLDEQQTMLGINIRGADEAAFVAADLVTRLGLRAIDTGSEDGTIFPAEDVLEGLQHWRSVRDRALGT